MSTSRSHAFFAFSCIPAFYCSLQMTLLYCFTLLTADLRKTLSGFMFQMEIGSNASSIPSKCSSTPKKPSYEVMNRYPQFPPRDLFQFPKSFFQIKFPMSTYIIVNRGHVKELVNASETYLSFIKTSNDSIEAPYTFGKTFAQNHYHIIVTRRYLTRGIPELFPGMVDELETALGEIFPNSEGIPPPANMSLCSA